MSEPVRQIVFPKRRTADLQTAEPAVDSVGPDEVSGRTVTSVISAGTEIGMQYDAADGFPHAPGYGAVFRIGTVGSEVRGLSPGDYVFCLGKHRSVQCFPQSEVVPVPGGLEPAVAVLARMIVIGWSALTMAAAHPPARVMVTGLGAVGHFATRLALRFGFRVAGVDPVPERQALLQRYDDISVFAEPPFGDPEWQESVNLCLECSGVESAVLEACTIAARGAEVVIVGVPWEEHGGVTAKQILYKLFWRNLVLRSGYEWELPWAPYDSVPKHPSPGVYRGVEYREHCSVILDLLNQNSLPVDGLYRQVPPEACADVYEELATGMPATLCTVIDWE